MGEFAFLNKKIKVWLVPEILELRLPVVDIYSLLMRMISLIQIF
ncbi:hypothetical protein Ga0061068_11129 [Tepidiphilus thermophilus]|uniref:Uncharacterized protein n=1 Tax=Tepidiphilus thermophilus TaxID=876478 RepID=A0A0K6IWN6_9PROT|nr:hypothetical protein Ga0061068_11129 [Tepidiphilus thermophilus]